MTTPGVLLYRCRLCGQQDRRIVVEDMIEAIGNAIVDVETFDAVGPPLTCLFGLHRCGGGRIGVMDLIGVVEAEEQAS